MKRPKSNNSNTKQEEISHTSVRCYDKFGELEVELDEDHDQCAYVEAGGLTAAEKKRRLGLDQVRALEKHFEVENKLDPDHKTRLAQDLGLQPRQVAVWFQNRRARSKTKQLERDFNELKNRHDEVLVECESLRRDKDALSAQIRELQLKLERSQTRAVKLEMNATAVFYRDGASDSDSSVVFNDEIEPIDQQCFIDTYTANFPCKGFLEETLITIPSNDQEFDPGTRFFPDEPVSDPLSWYGSDEWAD